MFVVALTAGMLRSAISDVPDDAPVLVDADVWVGHEGLIQVGNPRITHVIPAYYTADGYGLLEDCGLEPADYDYSHDDTGVLGVVIV